MNEHRYILEKSSKKHICPACGKKRFVRYIDTETNEYLPEKYGRCDREINCSYHLNPYSDSYNKNKGKQLVCKPQQKPASLIPVDVFKASLQGYEQNNLISYLNTLFGDEITSQLISQYFVGTSKHWQGATIFWQVDLKGKIRTGKIMLYSPDTGKRIKKPYNHITWVHKAVKLPDFSIKQCFFGEHLLRDKTKPVAIVESEKTAMIASIYLPNFIWLSAGSLSYLNIEKCKVLKGRNVTLFPDLNGFDKWKGKAKQLSQIANFNVSDLLEQKASEAERKQGLDLADYLIKFDLNEFTHTIKKENSVEVKQKPTLKQKPETWENDISKLKQYFNVATLPKELFRLNDWTKITDIHKFIDSHFATVEKYNGNPAFLPHLNRLKQLKEMLTINSY